MKRIIRTMFVFAAISMFATSCQKESFVEPIASEQQAPMQYSYNYTVDGISYSMHIENESDWESFVMNMLTLAEEGHAVTFTKYKNYVNASKEVVTYSTADKQDAYNWAANMASQGYTVTVTFDNNTGLFNCTAIRK